MTLGSPGGHTEAPRTPVGQKTFQTPLQRLLLKGHSACPLSLELPGAQHPPSPVTHTEGSHPAPSSSWVLYLGRVSWVVCESNEGRGCKGIWEVESWFPLQNSEMQKEGTSFIERSSRGPQGLERKRHHPRDLFLPGHSSSSAASPHLCPPYTGSTYPRLHHVPPASPSRPHLNVTSLRALLQQTYCDPLYRPQSHTTHIKEHGGQTLSSPSSKILHSSCSASQTQGTDPNH